MDDKAIGHAGFTVLSNNDSRKIALMIEITRAEEVEKALEKLGSHKHKIKNISMDMNSTYAMVFNDLVPRAVQVIDKFHVMKCVYQAVRDVRSGSVKELQQQLSRGRNRTDDDRKLLVEIEHLRRVSHAVTQSSDKWNEEMTETINQIFTKHDDLKIAYEIAQKFKRWYDYKNRMQLREKITENLHG